MFGHSVGDALLREAAQRMAAACEGAFLARIGGDEFVVISPSGPQPATAAALAARLQAALEPDIEIEGHALKVGLTIGVALYPQDGADAASLGRQCQRRALPRQGGGARRGALLRHVDGQAVARPARAAAGPDQRHRARRADAALPAAGAHRRRDHRLRGAGALAASAPRHGAALDLHSAGRGKRQHRRARRMGAARRLPRGGELAEAADRRHQSVAGAVPRRRPAQAGARGAAGDRALRPSGSSSRSPRAC